MWAKRTVAVLTAGVFLLTEISRTPLAQAASQVSPLVDQSIGIKAFTIPDDLGSVESSHQGEGDRPFLVLIQDAHGVRDAQEKIRGLIEFLQRRYGISTVAVEGTSGEMDAVLYRSFPDEFIRRKVLAEYLDRGEITGPGLASVLNRDQARYVGIEDWSLYEANWVAYRRAAEAREEVLSILRRREGGLKAEQEIHYSEDLKRFHAARTAFEEERLHLEDFLGELGGLGDPALSEPQSFRERYPHLAPLLRSISKKGSGHEGRLDLEVRGMADDFLGRYGKALEKGEARAFHRFHQAFLTGEIDAVPFLKEMMAIARKRGIVPRLTAATKQMLALHQGLSFIRGSRLFNELRSYLDELEAGLLKTPEQREIAGQYRRIRLLKDLATLKLTREDLEAFRLDRGEYLAAAPELEDSGILEPAMDFYGASLARDTAFYRNLDDLLGKKKAKSAIVVAGGFHAAGFEEHFKAAGYSYAVIVPRIESLAGEEKYEALMHGRFSYAQYLEGTFYDAFARHATLSLASALKGPDFRRTLKLWRDNLLRQLAAEGRLSESGAHTAYLDLLLKVYLEKFSHLAAAPRSREEILKAVEAELDRIRDEASAGVWRRFQGQVNRFLEGLRGLMERREMSPGKVQSLLESVAGTKTSFLVQGVNTNFTKGVRVFPWLREGGELPRGLRVPLEFPGVPARKYVDPVATVDELLHRFSQGALSPASRRVGMVAAERVAPILDRVAAPARELAASELKPAEPNGKYLNGLEQSILAEVGRLSPDMSPEESNQAAAVAVRQAAARLGIQRAGPVLAASDSHRASAVGAEGQKKVGEINGSYGGAVAGGRGQEEWQLPRAGLLELRSRTKSPPFLSSSLGFRKPNEQGAKQIQNQSYQKNIQTESAANRGAYHKTPEHNSGGISNEVDHVFLAFRRKPEHGLQARPRVEISQGILLDSTNTEIPARAEVRAQIDKVRGAAEVLGIRPIGRRGDARQLEIEYRVSTAGPTERILLDLLMTHKDTAEGSVYLAEDEDGDIISIKLDKKRATEEDLPGRGSEVWQGVAVQRFVESNGIDAFPGIVWEGFVRSGEGRGVYAVIRGNEGGKNLLEHAAGIALAQRIELAREILAIQRRIFGAGIALLDQKPRDIFMTKSGKILFVDPDGGLFVNRRDQKKWLGDLVPVVLASRSVSAAKDRDSGYSQDHAEPLDRVGLRAGRLAYLVAHEFIKGMYAFVFGDPSVNGSWSYSGEGIENKLRAALRDGAQVSAILKHVAALKALTRFDRRELQNPGRFFDAIDQHLKSISQLLARSEARSEARGIKVQLQEGAERIKGKAGETNEGAQSSRLKPSMIGDGEYWANTLFFQNDVGAPRTYDPSRFAESLNRISPGEVGRKLHGITLGRELSRDLYDAGFFVASFFSSGAAIPNLQTSPERRLNIASRLRQGFTLAHAAWKGGAFGYVPTRFIRINYNVPSSHRTNDSRFETAGQVSPSPVPAAAAPRSEARAGRGMSPAARRALFAAATFSFVALVLILAVAFFSPKKRMPVLPDVDPAAPPAERLQKVKDFIVATLKWLEDRYPDKKVLQDYAAVIQSGKAADSSTGILFKRDDGTIGINSAVLSRYLKIVKESGSPHLFEEWASMVVREAEGYHFSVTEDLDAKVFDLLSDYGVEWQKLEVEKKRIMAEVGADGRAVTARLTADPEMKGRIHDLGAKALYGEVYEAVRQYDWLNQREIYDPEIAEADAARVLSTLPEETADLFQAMRRHPVNLMKAKGDITAIAQEELRVQYHNWVNRLARARKLKQPAEFFLSDEILNYHYSAEADRYLAENEKLKGFEPSVKPLMPKLQGLLQKLDGLLEPSPRKFYSRYFPARSEARSPDGQAHVGRWGVKRVLELLGQRGGAGREGSAGSHRGFQFRTTGRLGPRPEQFPLGSLWTSWPSRLGTGYITHLLRGQIGSSWFPSFKPIGSNQNDAAARFSGDDLQNLIMDEFARQMFASIVGLTVFRFTHGFLNPLREDSSLAHPGADVASIVKLHGRYDKSKIMGVKGILFRSSEARGIALPWARALLIAGLGAVLLLVPGIAGVFGQEPPERFHFDPSFSEAEGEQTRDAVRWAIHYLPEMDVVLRDPRVEIEIGKTDDLIRLLQDLARQNPEQEAIQNKIQEMLRLRRAGMKYHGLTLLMAKDEGTKFFIFLQTDVYRAGVDQVMATTFHELAHVAYEHENLDVLRKWAALPREEQKGPPLPNEESIVFRREIRALETFAAELPHEAKLKELREKFPGLREGILRILERERKQIPIWEGIEKGTLPRPEVRPETDRPAPRPARGAPFFTPLTTVLLVIMVLLILLMIYIGYHKNYGSHQGTRGGKQSKKKRRAEVRVDASKLLDGQGLVWGSKAEQDKYLLDLLTEIPFVRDDGYAEVWEETVSPDRLLPTQPLYREEQLREIETLLRDQDPEGFFAASPSEDPDPMEAVKIGDRLYLINGHHRVLWAKALGVPGVKVKIYEPNWEAAAGIRGEDPGALRDEIEGLLQGWHEKGDQARRDARKWLETYADAIGYDATPQTVAALSEARRPQLMEVDFEHFPLLKGEDLRRGVQVLYEGDSSAGDPGAYSLFFEGETYLGAGPVELLEQAKGKWQEAVDLRGDARKLTDAANVEAKNAIRLRVQAAAKITQSQSRFNEAFRLAYEALKGAIFIVYQQDSGVEAAVAWIQQLLILGTVGDYSKHSDQAHSKQIGEALRLPFSHPENLTALVGLMFRMYSRAVMQTLGNGERIAVLTKSGKTYEGTFFDGGLDDPRGFVEITVRIVPVGHGPRTVPGRINQKIEVTDIVSIRRAASEARAQDGRPGGRTARKVRFWKTLWFPFVAIAVSAVLVAIFGPRLMRRWEAAALQKAMEEVDLLIKRLTDFSKPADERKKALDALVRMKMSPALRLYAGNTLLSRYGEIETFGKVGDSLLMDLKRETKGWILDAVVEIRGEGVRTDLTDLYEPDESLQKEASSRLLGVLQDQGQFNEVVKKKLKTPTHSYQILRFLQAALEQSVPFDLFAPVLDWMRVEGSRNGIALDKGIQSLALLAQRDPSHRDAMDALLKVVGKNYFAEPYRVNAIQALSHYELETKDVKTILKVMTVEFSPSHQSLSAAALSKAAVKEVEALKAMQARFQDMGVDIRFRAELDPRLDPDGNIRETMDLATGVMDLRIRHQDLAGPRSEARAAVYLPDSTVESRSPKSWMSFFNSDLTSANSFVKSRLASFKSALSFNNESSTRSSRRFWAWKPISRESRRLEFPWTAISTLSVFFPSVWTLFPTLSSLLSSPTWPSAMSFTSWRMSSKSVPTSVGEYSLSFLRGGLSLLMANLPFQTGGRTVSALHSPVKADLIIDNSAIQKKHLPAYRTRRDPIRSSRPESFDLLRAEVRSQPPQGEGPRKVPVNVIFSEIERASRDDIPKAQRLLGAIVLPSIERKMGRFKEDPSRTEDEKQARAMLGRARALPDDVQWIWMDWIRDLNHRLGMKLTTEQEEFYLRLMRAKRNLIVVYFLLHNAGVHSTAEKYRAKFLLIEDRSNVGERIGRMEIAEKLSEPESLRRYMESVIRRNKIASGAQERILSGLPRGNTHARAVGKDLSASPKTFEGIPGVEEAFVRTALETGEELYQKGASVDLQLRYGPHFFLLADYGTVPDYISSNQAYRLYLSTTSSTHFAWVRLVFKLMQKRGRGSFKYLVLNPTSIFGEPPSENSRLVIYFKDKAEAEAFYQELSEMEGWRELESATLTELYGRFPETAGDPNHPQLRRKDSETFGPLVAGGEGKVEYRGRGLSEARRLKGRTALERDRAAGERSRQSAGMFKQGDPKGPLSEARMDVGEKGEWFLNHPVEVGVPERPVYNFPKDSDFAHLTAKSTITWEEAAPLIQGDQQELERISRGEFEGALSADEVLEVIIYRMEELLYAPLAVKMEAARQREQAHFDMT